MMTVYKTPMFITSYPGARRAAWKFHATVEEINNFKEEQKNLLSKVCLFIYTNTTASERDCMPALLQFVKAGLDFNQCIEGLVFVINRGEIFGGEEKATKLYLEMMKNENNRS